MSEYRNTVFHNYQSWFLVILSSNYRYHLVLKILFPDHIFPKILKYYTENLYFPSSGKYYTPPLFISSSKWLTWSFNWLTSNKSLSVWCRLYLGSNAALVDSCILLIKLTNSTFWLLIFCSTELIHSSIWLNFLWVSFLMVF